jgi:endonuclease YncB( thermonuclease family)
VTSPLPALPRWRRGAVPFLVVAACAAGCGSTEDTPSRAASVQSASAASTTSTPTSTSTAPPPVRQVVDGRTLVSATGKRLQVVGLAAPGECWARAATEFATTTLAGKQVKLVTVAGDQVGVRLPDGSDFAETALRKGMARAESTANATLTAAQAIAQRGEVGLWGGTCKGQDTVAPPPPPPVTGVQPVVPPPPPPPASTPDPPATAYYKSCAAARAAGVTPLRLGDPGYGSHLDRDGDGIACE